MPPFVNAVFRLKESISLSVALLPPTSELMRRHLLSDGRHALKGPVLKR